LGEIDRAATGIFVRPQHDNIVGKVMPDIEDIVKTIARRDTLLTPHPSGCHSQLTIDKLFRRKSCTGEKFFALPLNSPCE
jgi:hypothetical protein